MEGKRCPLNSSRGIIDEEGEKMRRRRRRGPQSRHLHTLCCTEPRRKGRGNVERLSPAVIRAISGGVRKRRKRGGTVPVFNTGGARFNILYNCFKKLNCYKSFVYSTFTYMRTANGTVQAYTQIS